MNSGFVVFIQRKCNWKKTAVSAPRQMALRLITFYISNPLAVRPLHYVVSYSVKQSIQNMETNKQDNIKSVC